MTAICPQCGSGKVEPTGDGVSCKDCGWLGKEGALINAPIPIQGVQLDFSNQDVALEVARQISRHLMELIYQLAAKAMGEAILQSGLVGRTDTKNLARLLRAGCLGAHKAVLEEADDISEEFKAQLPAIRQ